jgi:hypothetical protein
MPIPWLTLLKVVPWSDVIANAPTVANGARKLWNSVSGRSPAVKAPPTDMGNPLYSEDEAMARLHEELRGLRITTAELHQQMLTSSELIRELAEQNDALIQRLEAYRQRQRWLLAGVALLALAALALHWTG